MFLSQGKRSVGKNIEHRKSQNGMRWVLDERQKIVFREQSSTQALSFGWVSALIFNFSSGQEEYFFVLGMCGVVLVKTKNIILNLIAPFILPMLANGYS